MKRSVVTFARPAAAGSAQAREAGGKHNAAPATAPPEPKKPSVVCTGGVCSEPEPPAAKKKEAPAEYENLKFGIYGIADLALLYRDNVLNDPANPSAGTTNYLAFISGRPHPAPPRLSGTSHPG